MSSLTEFEGKKKKKTPPTKASPWPNGLREKKRDWTYLIVFSVAQGGWEREREREKLHEVFSVASMSMRKFLAIVGWVSSPSLSLNLSISFSFSQTIGLRIDRKSVV